MAVIRDAGKPKACGWNTKCMQKHRIKILSRQGLTRSSSDMHRPRALSYEVGQHWGTEVVATTRGPGQTGKKETSDASPHTSKPSSWDTLEQLRGQVRNIDSKKQIYEPN